MRETRIEQALTAAVQARGGLCWKLTSPGTAGVPDRLIILPDGAHGFIEVKRPGGKLRPIQQHRLNQLHALDQPAYVIDQPNQIERVLDEIQTT